MDLVHPSSKFPLPLPEDIICHILCLLPVKTLVALRCVSRQWCSLIDSPYFVKLHIECSITTSSNLTLIFHTSVDKYVRNVWDDYFSHDGENIPDGGLYSLDFVNFESESDSDSESEFTCTALHPLDDNPMKNVVEDASLTQVIASCNGLLLLAERRTGYVFILWNPCTGKYHKIPELPLTDRLYFNNSCFCDDVYGFGYDLINQDYKLVWIVTKFMLNTERQQVYVYSLNSDSWRRVLDLFRYDIGFNATHAVLVNNTLHWTGYPPASPNWDEYPDYVIVAFDLVAEECHELPHPNDVDLHCFHTVLSVFEGCLSLISVPNRVDWDVFDAHVWAMKIYGIKESWTKLFTVKNLPVIRTGSYYNVKAVAYSKRRDKILLDIDGSRLVWYDLKRKRAKNVKIHGAPSFMR